VSPTTTRVLRAVTEKIASRDLTDCAGGTVSVIVQLDRAGCPKRVTLRREDDAPPETTGLRH
jgi:hypothetical protein